MSNLIDLTLSSNCLTNSIPRIDKLQSLINLDLAYNQLDGNIPSSLYRLSGITSLHLQSNRLTGTIPSSLGSLNNLYELLLFSNSLSRTIPTSIFCITNLLYLGLHFNKLTGSIPTEIGYLLNVQHLYFYHNKLTHSIPTQLGLLRNMWSLVLLSNSLTGTVPSALCVDELLSILSFGFNSLSCYAPCLSSVASLDNGLINVCTENVSVSMIPNVTPTSAPGEDLNLNTGVQSHKTSVSLLVHLDAYSFFSCCRLYYVYFPEFYHRAIHSIYCWLAM